MSASVRSAHVRATLCGLEAVGLPAGELARRAGIELAALDDPERWIPAPAVHALWARAAELDPAPDLGLRVGTSVPQGALDVFDYLVPACATLGDAFVLVERLHRVATTTSYFHVVVPPDDDVRVESRLKVPGVQIHPLGRDYVFTLLLERLRRADARMRPVRVELRGSALAAPHRYEELMGAPVSFGHEASVLHFRRSTWQLPMSGADAGLRASLERHASALAEKAPTADLVDRARSELSRMIVAGHVDVATLAKRLGQSPRTLQRRLVERGLGYSALLDEARRDLACAYLRGSELSIDEIAGLLSYSETSAFSRAFRRWTGSSPARFRGATAQD